MDNTNMTLGRQLPHINLVIVLLLMVLLTSCTHVKRTDGPPNFYVDETKIPNAVPKHEALAKYGNMPSYKVFGKRYYTMKHSHNYQEVGVASWYGTLFHERRTSSGEKYDMLGMTAAHKTLPLPTYVEVTNLKNNRKIIVKVNDRGPFESNRIIDLSYVAAKKLGMVGHGTALVKLKAINPRTYGKEADTHGVVLADNRRASNPVSKQHRVAVHKSTPSMYLQVGAFRQRVHAERLKQRLSGIVGVPVKVAKGKLYRVQVGPFKDVATANRISLHLRQIGLKPNKSYS